MKRKKPTMYDAQEALILKQSSSFVEFLMRAGMLEDKSMTRRYAKPKSLRCRRHTTTRKPC